MPDTNTDINYSVGHTLISVRTNFLKVTRMFFQDPGQKSLRIKGENKQLL